MKTGKAGAKLNLGGPRGDRRAEETRRPSLLPETDVFETGVSARSSKRVALETGPKRESPVIQTGERPPPRQRRVDNEVWDTEGPQFQAALKDMLSKGCRDFTNTSRIPRLLAFVEFLRTEGYLFHGSNNRYIDSLTPRQAHCNAKKFGSQVAVYATEDSVLPFFYGCFDRTRAQALMSDENRGWSCGRTMPNEREGTFHYALKAAESVLREEPWCDGAIYVMDGSDFVQGTSDDGHPISEWASSDPVTPVGKLSIPSAYFAMHLRHCCIPR